MIILWLTRLVVLFILPNFRFLSLQFTELLTHYEELSTDCFILAALLQDSLGRSCR